MASQRKKIVVSASRRTDIPAYFSNWFLQRISDGFIYRQHPYTKKISPLKTSLAPDDVLAIVFWTKDAGPLISALPVLDQMGYFYYFQYTLNPYDQTIEQGLRPLEERLTSMITLSERIGPERVIWRYDPIILSKIHNFDWHLQHFSRLAREISPHVSSLTISFYDSYRKTIPRMRSLDPLYERDKTAIWTDQTKKFLQKLCQIALSFGLNIGSCSETLPLHESGIMPVSCIDINLINRLTNNEYKIGKDTGQREKCLCAKSIDIGVYHTCRSACLYCYAN